MSERDRVDKEREKKGKIQKGWRRRKRIAGKQIKAVHGDGKVIFTLQFR